MKTREEGFYWVGRDGLKPEVGWWCEGRWYFCGELTPQREDTFAMFGVIGDRIEAPGETTDDFAYDTRQSGDNSWR